MKEIGGFLELDRYKMPMLHENSIKLNSARNCLAYLIQTREIKRILLPKYLCESISNVCTRMDVDYEYYSIESNFLPQNINLDKNEWLYIVNYFGQISNEKILEMKKRNVNIIVDNVQAFFQNPTEGVDTIYTCRKFFGVPDGAFLYMNNESISSLDYLNNIPVDESQERMKHILGRYEKSASEYYDNYLEHEEYFSRLPIKRMSKLTYNLLHGIDYKEIAKIRERNFLILNNALFSKNMLKLTIPIGPFMYPFYIENGAIVRKRLQEKKIYIPTLWPEVLKLCKEDELEYKYVTNILPLPIDQRYDEADMDYIIDEVIKCID